MTLLQTLLTIRVGDKFEIEPGVFAECPGSCGTARNDCQCRCFLEYSLMNIEEFAKATGKTVEEVKKSLNIQENYVAKSAESGIIEKTNKESENNEVHTIGKIDRNIYKCITEDIVTDEVVLTDKQILHIKERHPNDYERFAGYFSDIVAAPDYIIKGNKPKSALILKEIVDNGEMFKTVLRLITSTDENGYKNSIITFMKIDKKEWNRLLRNTRQNHGFLQ